MKLDSLCISPALSRIPKASVSAVNDDSETQHHFHAVQGSLFSFGCDTDASLAQHNVFFLQPLLFGAEYVTSILMASV